MFAVKSNARAGAKLLSEVTGWSVTNVGFLTALGGATTTAVMLFVGWHSDRRKERYLHLAGMIALMAASAAAMALLSGPMALAPNPSPVPQLESPSGHDGNDRRVSAMAVSERHSLSRRGNPPSAS